jgi:outer membrane protein, adhesin transport system
MRSSALISMLCISLGSVLSSFPCVTSAQESAIPDTENRVDAILSKITLEKVLRIAAETHPSIAQRLSEQGASDYSVAGARWQRWPGVSMSSSRGPLGSTLTELQLEQPLWTGGRITANINAAEARADAARQSVLEARKIIIERAINAYAEAMRLQSRIAIADAAIEDFEALTGMIDRRVENGISPKADAVNVRARLQQANSERLQLQLQRRNTRTELELLIGQRFSDLAVPQALLAAAISLEDAVHIALENAPELARLNAEERVAEETIAATRSSLSPSLSLRYQRIFGGGTLYATDQLFLGVTYQPGSGLSSLSAISEAEARRTGTAYTREAVRLELMNRVRNLWQQAESSRRELKVLGDLVALTQEVYASCLRQFPVGRRTWLELLLARRDATQAQYALSDTQWTGFAAELKLQLVTGELAARNYRINTEVSE